MRRVALLSMGLFALALGGALGAAEKVAHLRGESSDAIPNPAPIEAVPLAVGRILAVDGAHDRLVVEHRGIGRYYIDPGKSVIHVRDHDRLRGLSPGDKIRFDVERTGGRLVVTRLENSN
jgi:Cu/Ag efflux protein CusF